MVCDVLSMLQHILQQCICTLSPCDCNGLLVQQPEVVTLQKEPQTRLLLILVEEVV